MDRVHSQQRSIDEAELLQTLERPHAGCGNARFDLGSGLMQVNLYSEVELIRYDAKFAKAVVVEGCG